jgi:predicted dehydrogenase
MEISRSACVVGAGMIGRHHAASLLASGFSVTVVDPINPNIPDIEWFDTLNQNIISQNEVFIISTTAEHHFKIVRSISKSQIAKIIIIEKPLFCNRSEYLEFNSEISTSEHKVLCNVPYFYHNELHRLKSSTDLGLVKNYSVYGSNWGMACNILHDISIVDVLSHTHTLELFNLTSDISSIKESKRVGYLEVFGSVEFLLNNIPVNLICNENGPLEKVIEIEFERGSVKIDLFAEIITKSLHNNKTATDSFITARASETTGFVVEQLMAGNNVLPEASRYSSASLQIYEMFAKSLGSASRNLLDYPFS